MKIKKILAGIIGAAVLIPTFIYTVGTLTQFIHSGAAWTQGGSNFSEAPIRVKVDLDHCLAALLDFPYCLIATGIFIGAVVYGLYKIGELGNPKNKGAGIDGNIKISKGHELGSSEFLSGSDIRDTFDISKAENTIKDILGVQKDGKVICLKGGYGFNEHLAVCGSSGSGKSRCISRNLIMQCALRGESIVVTDPNGYNLVG